MKKSLVFLGGVLGILTVSGCGDRHPPLNIVPAQSEMYPGYKGDISRNGYLESDQSGEMTPLWQIKFKYPLFNQPSLAGDYIFQPGSDKKIHVIDIKTGVEIAEIKVRRHIGTTPELSGRYMAICEEGESSELLVIDYIEGQLLWSAKTDRVCLQPVLYDNRIFWVDGRNRINCADLENGEKLWTKKIAGGFDAGPIIGDDRLFVVSGDSTVYSLNPADGQVVWDIKGPGRTNSSPAFSGNELYICDANGLVTCYDAISGEMLWSHDDGTRLFYSPSVDAEGIYYGSGDGRFVKLDRRTGAKFWEFDTGSPVRGTALVNEKAVIFTSLDYTVYILDKFSGRPITSYVAGGMVSAAPVLHDDKLLIAAQDKFLNCFSLRGED
jgi:outer membrane protein assembly factor BamB